MITIELTIPHNLSRQEARVRIQNLISDGTAKYGKEIQNIEAEWRGDTCRFRFDFKKFPFSGSISGDLSVNDSDVTMKGNIPDSIAPFKNIIESAIRRKGEEFLS
jgi:hypothetical protein